MREFSILDIEDWELSDVISILLPAPLLILTVCKYMAGRRPTSHRTRYLPHSIIAIQQDAETLQVSYYEWI